MMQRLALPEVTVVRLGPIATEVAELMSWTSPIDCMRNYQIGLPVSFTVRYRDGAVRLYRVQLTDEPEFYGEFDCIMFSGSTVENGQPLRVQILFDDTEPGYAERPTDLRFTRA